MRLSAQAKGAGMISPHFATLLCFVQTDAALDAATLDLLLGATCARSFERISVDGQLSTNDTVVLMASGASGVRVAPETEDELRFGEALDALLRQLAICCRRATARAPTRVGRVVVRGGQHLHVEAAARAVADSPLVKTALHGGDPNWGRIAQAVGHGAARHRAAAAGHRHRGRARAGGRRARSTTMWPTSSSASPARRSTTRSACRARGPRPRCSSPTSATPT